MTSAFDTAFLSRLRAKLGTELEHSSNALLDGTLDDFETYKHKTGYRKGLLRAIEIAGQVETELLSPEKRKAG